MRTDNCEVGVCKSSCVVLERGLDTRGNGGGIMKLKKALLDPVGVERDWIAKKTGKAGGGMLLCRGIPEENSSGSVPVYLNVYDLTPFNGYAYWLGLGVYHSGVQVHGVEYAYGAHEYPSTGIFEAEPQRCEGFTLRKSMLIAKTDLGLAEVRAVMEELSGCYRGNTYHLITKNCNHFCNDVCVRLTGNPIPSWINRLARIGFFCNCVLPASLCLTKVQHHKMEEKFLVEQERTILTDRVMCATKNLSPSSSSSSSRPSDSHQGRSRSRSRSRVRRAQAQISSPSAVILDSPTEDSPSYLSS